ncbi:hypothetical protein CgunFtcFv8_022949 [Champsocephalus gunnari]|uniref:Uncharacterized protein n=1 Tax=Champsocephalus gunnari TaxID=52237 RepID=A0AAN8DJF7_CHAGU|nr:hypothetical protein CgunFtcFv8_022949 [Champsocephalus gunnari]
MASGEGYSKQNSEAVERLLKMEPKVECTVNSMRLEVQDAASTPGSLFFVDRGSGLSPLPLSKLPQSCGYTIRSTQRDLVVVAPYDGCFVAVEENYYVLPLRWYGLPVRMSCPMMKQSSPDPPRVTCHDQGMIVKTSWIVPVAKIVVNLDGNWEPLMKASARCGFSVVLHPEGAVISVRYAPCLGIKDGMYTLELAGEGETKISCPSLSAVSEFPGKPYQGHNLKSQLHLPYHPSLTLLRGKYSSPSTPNQHLTSQLLLPNLPSLTLLRAQYSSPSSPIPRQMTATAATPQPDTSHTAALLLPPPQLSHSLMPHRAQYSSPSSPSSPSPSTLSQRLNSQLLLPNVPSLTLLRAQYSSPSFPSPTTLRQRLNSQLLLPNLHSLTPHRAQYSSPSSPSPCPSAT